MTLLLALAWLPIAISTAGIVWLAIVITAAHWHAYQVTKQSHARMRKM